MKLKTLSMLIAVSLSAGALTGCNFYDSPPNNNVEEPENGNPPPVVTPPPELPDTADVVTKSSDELILALSSAESGQIIGLSNQGNFDFTDSIEITKDITLVSTDADGNVISRDTASNSAYAAADNYAVISGTTCINIPDSADQVLKGTEGVRIANIKFENINVIECGTDSTSKSVINIGKVGDGAVPVTLDGLVFDGATINEDGSHGWIYSRGYVNVSNSQFLDKKNAGMDVINLNCGSNRVVGGSAASVGSVFDNNEFTVLDGESNSGLRGVVAGLQFKDKTCQATVSNNSFSGFESETTTFDDTGAAIADGSGDGATIEGNTFGDDEGGNPDPITVINVDELNEAISEAAAGTVITLDAAGTFDSGVINVDKAVIIDGGEGNNATITGDACFTVKAAGAEIKNLAFENNKLGWDDENDVMEETCALGSSDGQSGAISVDAVSGAPVKLSNLTFDAANTTDFGTKKASWVFSWGQFELTDSTFNNLSGSIQNNGVFVNCGKSQARQGSVLSGNTFNITAGGSEVAAIKVGDSSSAIIKDTDNNNECNITVTDSTFNGYVVEHTQDMSDSASRQAAIFAREEAGAITKSGNIVTP